ncbi:hypothetical protein KP509_38G026600 [Ceratopteris richardii]|uniref:Uncharacterized protein n=1 Tax=Ceratopteris richardii TaxID=49495 RepID=A0A8T2Q3A8_CERRI|nr:hypothetical protein KP509_38G026600 [Ceratopteris richardii]
MMLLRACAWRYCREGPMAPFLRCLLLPVPPRRNMSGFNLEGVLPNDAFSKLTSLRSLDFFYNQLRSPFPSLDNLKNLHDLNFSQNFFTGSFPETIFNLPNLVDL